MNLFQYGCNPSGATATIERKRETLELVREHDILIFEGLFYVAELNVFDCINACPPRQMTLTISYITEPSPVLPPTSRWN